MANRSGDATRAPHRPAPTRWTVGRGLGLASLLSAVLVLSSAAATSAEATNSILSSLSLRSGWHQLPQHPSASTCAVANRPNVAHCDARIRLDKTGRVPAPGRRIIATPQVIGNGGAYDPAYLDSAYNVSAAIAAGNGGSGQIVALVEAYDDPRLANDLATYRAHFGLPACHTGTVSATNSGCVFQKVNEFGVASPLPAGDTSWGSESSLDVAMVSAICSRCQILVVEANSALISDLGRSVNTAVALGANVVSNSYGSGEYASETSDASTYYNHPGVAIVASSGDAGYGVQFPAAAPTVTAVGGTSLVQLSNGGVRNGYEVAWSGAGSGCSQFEPKPIWQSDSGCAHRTVADVAAVADPNTGVWAYDSFGFSGYEIFGGTSVAAPIVGSLYALAGNQSGSLTQMSSLPYASRSSLTHINSGANGRCATYLCNAALSQNGYNGPTGLGSPGASPSSMGAFSVGAATLSAPSAPTLTSALAGTASVALSWTAPSSSGSSPITGYNIFVATSPGGEGSTPTNPTPIVGNSYVVSNLSGLSTYYFTVRALNNLSMSPGSNELSAFVPSGYIVPSAPVLTSAISANRSVALTWTSPSSVGGGVTGYNVYVGTFSNGESAVPANHQMIGLTRFTVSGLANGLTYYFTVRAVNPSGQSAPSNQLVARPASTPTSPGNFSAHQSARTGVSLTWSAPSNNGGALVASYVIFRSTSSGHEARFAIISCSQTTCTFTDASTAHAAKYFYRVAAISSVGVGSASSEKSAVAA